MGCALVFLSESAMWGWTHKVETKAPSSCPDRGNVEVQLTWRQSEGDPERTFFELLLEAGWGQEQTASAHSRRGAVVRNVSGEPF